MPVEIYVTILKGDDRLVITGNMSLLEDFFATLGQGKATTICNPAPQASEITCQAKHD